jgi:hypothetical protein
MSGGILERQWMVAKADRLPFLICFPVFLLALFLSVVWGAYYLELCGFENLAVIDTSPLSWVSFLRHPIFFIPKYCFFFLVDICFVEPTPEFGGLPSSRHISLLLPTPSPYIHPHWSVTPIGA